MLFITDGEMCEVDGFKICEEESTVKGYKFKQVGLNLEKHIVIEHKLNVDGACETLVRYFKKLTENGVLDCSEFDAKENNTAVVLLDVLSLFMGKSFDESVFYVDEDHLYADQRLAVNELKDFRGSLKSLAVVRLVLREINESKDVNSQILVVDSNDVVATAKYLYGDLQEVGVKEVIDKEDAWSKLDVFHEVVESILLNSINSSLASCLVFLGFKADNFKGVCTNTSLLNVLEDILS